MHVELMDYLWHYKTIRNDNWIMGELFCTSLYKSYEIMNNYEIKNY